MSSLNEASDVSLRAARALSHELFGGGQYRLEIGAAIANGDGIANTAELASQLGLPRQTVSYELLLLERVGLLQREEQGSGRKVYFTRLASAYWAWCQEGQSKAAEMLGRRPPF